MQRLCYFCCQFRPVAPGQEVQRRIHSGRQPGRGQERAAVHIPDSTLPMNPWVNALEPVDITPMSRSRLAVDGSALGQHFGAGTPGEQERVPACLPSDPRDDRRIYGRPDIDDLGDDYDVGITVKPRRQVFEREMGNQIQSAGKRSHGPGGGDGVDVVFAGFREHRVRPQHIRGFAEGVAQQDGHSRFVRIVNGRRQWDRRGHERTGRRSRHDPHRLRECQYSRPAQPKPRRRARNR